MKALTISMMFAAAVAMAAPSIASAQPNGRARHYSPRAGTYSQPYNQNRNIRLRIIRLNNQKLALMAQNARLKRYAKRMRARGQHRQALRARRTMNANVKRLQVLRWKINQLRRSLTASSGHFRYKSSVKKHRRASVKKHRKARVKKHRRTRSR